MTNDEKWQKLMKLMSNEMFDQSGSVRIIFQNHRGDGIEYCTTIKDFDDIMGSEHMFLPPRSVTESSIAT